MRSLLFAFDGAAATDSVIGSALSFASQSDCHVSAVGLVNSAWLERPFATPAGGLAFRDALVKRELATAETAVARAMASFREAANRTDLRWEAQTLNGDPAKILEDQSTEHDAILLAHDATFQTDCGAGELAPCVKDLLRREPRPVMLLPSDAEPIDWNAPALVAFDGSASASRSLHFFAALGLAARRPVHVLNVGHSPAAAELAASAACRLLSRHACPDARAIGLGRDNLGHAAEAILDLAKGIGASTLVMGAFGRKGVRAFFGSTTTRLIQACPTAIFLAH